jgi:KDO2-lipid IV(A) lauroyltransferase
MSADYLQYKAANFLSRVLPRRFAYWIGLRVADRFYSHDARGRSAVMANLRHIIEFGGRRPSRETLERLARKTFQHFGKYMVDFFRYARLPRSHLERTVSIQHIEHVDEVRRADRGAIVVSAHVGNWEIGGAVLASLGCPMNAVILPEKDRRTRALFQTRREERGMNVIPVDNPVRGILRALRRREFVALLADREYGARYDMFEFFGKPARFPVGPATLCLKAKVPMLAGFLLREADDTFLLRFYPPVYPERHLTVGDVQQQVCRILEREIGENPAQWFMFDEFWDADREIR